MNRTPTILIALAIAVSANVAGACGSSYEDEESGPPDTSRFDSAFADARAPIAGLYAEASELLDGGLEAFEARLAELEGTPVVVNKWASWCIPCREEFPILQDVASAHAKDVAFVGIDGMDASSAALSFLRQAPLPYPSYSDPEEEIIEAIGAEAAYYPAMIFYDSEGTQTFIHAGPYESAADLEADIESYAK